MQHNHCRGRAAALLLVLGTGLAGAQAAEVDYHVFNHRVLASGAASSQTKAGLLFMAPGAQSDTVSLVEAAGHAITSVTYNSALGTTGWKADAMSVGGFNEYESSISLDYFDAVTLAVASQATLAGNVTVSMTVNGGFSGSTSRGNTGYQLDALGKSTGLFYQREPNLALPGTDVVHRVPTGPGLGVSSDTIVAAGAPFVFTDTLSLSQPLALLSPALLGFPHPPLIISPTAQNGPGCTAEHPCFSMARGPGVVAPWQVHFQVGGTMALAGKAGLAGDSVIDQSHTASLAIQMPADSYFLLGSGALRDAAGSAFLVMPVQAVPEPTSALLLALGLAAGLLARGRRRWRPALLAVVAAGAAAGAGAQASFSTQAHFDGSWRSVSFAGTTTLDQAYDETPADTVSPFEPDSAYRFRGLAQASGAMVAGVPTLKALAAFSGHHLVFDKSPLVPFGSVPLAQAQVTLTDTVTPSALALAPGAPMVMTLGFKISGSTSLGGPCPGLCGLDPPFVPGLMSALTAVQGPVYDFRPFGAGVGVLTLNLDVFNGVPFDMSLTLYAVARADRDAALRLGFDSSPGYYNSLGTADFLHTMVLDELSAHAAGSGAALSGVVLSGSDGSAWRTASAVPEPAAWALCSAGLLGLLAWRCRCRGPTARSSR